MSTVGIIILSIIGTFLYFIIGAVMCLTSLNEVFDDYKRSTRIICRFICTIFWPIIITIAAIGGSYYGLKWIFKELTD